LLEVIDTYSHSASACRNYLAYVSFIPSDGFLRVAHEAGSCAIYPSFYSPDSLLAHVLTEGHAFETAKLLLFFVGYVGSPMYRGVVQEGGSEATERET
jgi:hypothetical protein